MLSQAEKVMPPEPPPSPGPSLPFVSCPCTVRYYIADKAVIHQTSSKFIHWSALVFFILSLFAIVKSL